MKAPVFLIALAAGSLIAAAPALAHKAERTAPPPSPIAAEKAKADQKPEKSEPAPRICLFSVNGKAKAPAPAANAKKQSAATTPEQAKPRERACNVATPPKPAPLG